MSLQYNLNSLSNTATPKQGDVTLGATRLRAGDGPA